MTIQQRARRFAGCTFPSKCEIDVDGTIVVKAHPFHFFLAMALLFVGLGLACKYLVPGGCPHSQQLSIVTYLAFGLFWFHRNRGFAPMLRIIVPGTPGRTIPFFECPRYSHADIECLHLQSIRRRDRGDTLYLFAELTTHKLVPLFARWNTPEKSAECREKARELSYALGGRQVYEHLDA